MSHSPKKLRLWVFILAVVFCFGILISVAVATDKVQYTVTFNVPTANGVPNVVPVDIYEGQTISDGSFPVPEVPGFRLDYWYDATTKQVIDEETIILSDMVAIAKMKPVYEITFLVPDFETDGVTEVKTCVDKQFDDDDNVIPVTIPETLLPSVGYTKGRHFVCWQNIMDGNKEWTPDYTISANAVFKVYFEAHQPQAIAAVEPTCTEAGSEACLKCKGCDFYFVEPKEIPALGHSYKDTVTAPTCTAEGYTTHICERCDDTYTDSVVAAPGHTSEVLQAVAPTCTETGLTAGEKCSVCDEILVKQETVKANGHDVATLEAVAPTCIKTGLTEGMKCRVCAEILVEQKELPALGHEEEIIVGKAASCEATGLTYGVICSVCDEILEEQQEIPATGHDEVIIPAVEPTLESCGSTEGKKCSVCNKVTLEPVIIPQKTHTIVVLPGKSATCTEDGLTEGATCTTCHAVLKEQVVIPATGHSEEILTGKAATCTEKGLSNGKRCTVCNVVTEAQVELDALGHKEVTIIGTTASCTKAGITDGKKCTVCDTITVAQTEIAATGHTEEVITGKAATCGEAGLTEGKKCSVCNEILTAQTEIAATGEHTYGEWVTITEPTATEAGSKKHTCSVCGKEETEELPATGEIENPDTIDAVVITVVLGMLAVSGAYVAIRLGNRTKRQNY